jgi:hypothetical protein
MKSSPTAKRGINSRSVLEVKAAKQKIVPMKVVIARSCQQMHNPIYKISL